MLDLLERVIPSRSKQDKPFDPDDVDPKFYQDLDDKFMQAQEARLPLERTWLENLAFYMNKQWLQWDSIRRQLVKPEVPTYRVLMTVNLIVGVVTNEHAKITQHRPNIGVQPASDDPKDVAKAKIAQKILDYLWGTTNTDVASKRAALWSLICGTGLWKVYWDPTLGDPLGDNLFTGEIVVDEVSPFEFFPEPFGETIEQKNWVFQQKLRSSDYVYEKYGVRIAPQAYASDEFIEGRLAAILDSADVPRREGVLIKEFWQRRTRDWPQGRYVCYADDRILDARGNPYPYRMQLPYVAMPHITTPGRFFGESRISHLIDVQRNYNKSRSQAVEIRNLMSKPQWLIPKGSIDREITSAPGQQIEYTPIRGGARYPAKPEPVAGRDVPNTFWKDMDTAMKELMTVSGQHEVTNAQVPGQVKSGTAIQYLQEQDDLRLSPTAQAYETAIEQVEKMKIVLAKQYYKEQRTAKIAGPSKRVEVIKFYKEDLPDEADISVEAGSSLPKSRVAKQQFLLELWDRKLMQDPRQLIQLLDLGDVEGLYRDIELDIAGAERENEAMKTSGGKVANVEDFDDHDVHIHTHNAFRKGEEYETLSPEVRDAFRKHVASHQALSDQQQKAKLALQMAMDAKKVVTGKMTPGQEASIFPSVQQSSQAPEAPDSGAPKGGAMTAREATATSPLALTSGAGPDAEAATAGGM